MPLISHSTKAHLLGRLRSFNVLLRLDPSNTHFINNLRRQYNDIPLPWTHVPVFEGLPIWARHRTSKILTELAHSDIQPFEIAFGRPFIRKNRTFKSVGFNISSNKLHILHSKISRSLPDVIAAIKANNQKHDNKYDSRLVYQPRVMFHQKVGIDEAEQTLRIIESELDLEAAKPTIIGFTLREKRLIGETLEGQMPDEEFPFVK